MNDPEQANKIKEQSDIVFGFVTSLIILTAIAIGILSYSYNSRIILSSVVALIVVIQGLITWRLSAGKRRNK